MRAPVCVCHPKHNQAGPTRVRACYRRFHARSNFRAFTCTLARGDHPTCTQFELELAPQTAIGRLLAFYLNLPPFHLLPRAP